MIKWLYMLLIFFICQVVAICCTAFYSNLDRVSANETSNKASSCKNSCTVNIWMASLRYVWSCAALGLEPKQIWNCRFHTCAALHWCELSCAPSNHGCHWREMICRNLNICMAFLLCDFSGVSWVFAWGQKIFHKPHKCVASSHHGRACEFSVWFSS